MLERHSGRALYRQVADELRSQIESGALAPGAELPSEGELAARYGLGRDAVRQALALLRSEGLIVSLRGRLSQVREIHPLEIVAAPSQARVTARMPTPADHVGLEIPDGVPVLVVRTMAGEKIYLADRTEVQIRK